jgi:hypothetical protein
MRFKKAELRQRASFSSATMRTPAGDAASREEALHIFLVRMANPGQWHTLQPLTGNRERRSCSRIFYAVLNHVYHRFAWTLQDINRWELHMPRFAAAIRRKQCPYVICMGFIDGTLVRAQRCAPPSPAAPRSARSLSERHKRTYKGNRLTLRQRALNRYQEDALCARLC